MGEIIPRICIEELAWTCECGTAMGLEINNGQGGWFDLDCRQCGIVGSISIRPKPPKPEWMPLNQRSADE